jgi:hypothetical protein
MALSTIRKGNLTIA